MSLIEKELTGPRLAEALIAGSHLNPDTICFFTADPLDGDLRDAAARLGIKKIFKKGALDKLEAFLNSLQR